MSTLAQPDTASRVPAEAVFPAAPEARASSPGIDSFAEAVRKAAFAWIVSKRPGAYIPVDMRFEGLSAVVHKPVYHPRETGEQPLQLTSVDYENITSVAQQYTFEDAQTTETTAEVSITRGLEAGANAGFEIPAIGLGVGIDVRASVSTTRTQVLTTTQSWDWFTVITVPPRTRVTAEAQVKEVQYDLQFTAGVRIDGDPRSCVLVVKNNRGKGYLAFRNSPGAWFTLSPVPGFKPDGTAVIYDVEGRMTDVQGIAVDIKVQEYPLDGDGAVAARSYVLENEHAQPQPEEVEGEPVPG